MNVGEPQREIEVIPLHEPVPSEPKQVEPEHEPVYEPEREPNIVVGEVYLWGKIVDCQYGYRAQYAYPKRFYSNSYEYNYAYNNSTFALREFDVPVEPMPETVTQPEFVQDR